MHTDIKTFEDACKALNIDPQKLPDFSIFPVKHQTAMQAHAKLVIIAEAINEGWTPNWKEYDQNKYSPWFDMNDEDASDGFSFNAADCDSGTSDVGSRLCFSSREKAKYASTQFLELYKEYFVIKPD